ncbi:hypothetical protein BDN71DRAFT_1444608 [Pleurotus eryngii]|uniref:Uncharacterized protein n=1 Tax=Pleurotus eryngii TaxID=5323 RepID=A0A9P6A267_PLEER|nr:hypothetical protein BDN71DRAFT_1444608 [Pleurotus eryngii]
MNIDLDDLIWKTIGGLVCSMPMAVSTWIYRFPNHCFTAIAFVAIILGFNFSFNLEDEDEATTAKERTDTRDALHALQNVVVPTSGTWPSAYGASLISVTTEKSPCRSKDPRRLQEADPASTRELKTIKLPLFQLVQDLIAGRMELRTPADMDDFLSNTLKVYDWHILLEVESTRLPSLVTWLAKSQYGGLKPEDILEHRGNRTECAVSLDIAPFSEISKIFRLMDNTLQHGTRASIYFSSIAPDLAFLGPEYTICAVSFFMRQQTFARPILSKERYTHDSDPPRRAYTSTPLLLNLAKVTGLLANHAPGLHVDYVQDVSLETRLSLIHEEKQLAEDSKTRKAYVRRYNIRAYLEERFMLAWEAGLLGNGNLQRWKVRVSKR